MGLHFYRNPDEVDAENAAAKLDRAAAQRRSAIRREPTIRPGRDHSSSAGLTNIIRNRHEMRQARMRTQRQSHETDAQIAVLEAELERLRRQRERGNSRPRSEETRTRLVRHTEALTAGSSDAPAPGDVYLTTDENDLTASEESLVEHILLPRPARESSLRFEVAATSTNHLESPQQQSSFMPSPPHSLSETNRSRPVDGPLDSWEGTPSLTHGFAPAQAARAALGHVDGPTDATSEVMRTNGSERHGLDTPPPESWENSYSPLRRVPHMSPRPLPRSAIDGLGDRHRSPSPTSDQTEAEMWNDLLATTAGGNTAGSTSTSFASISDLLTGSRSSSYRSSNTQNTSTSFGEIGTSAEDTCDLPPGITQEDVRQIRDRHRRIARRANAPRRYIPEPDYDEMGDRSDAILTAGTEIPLSVLIREARESRERRQRRRDESMMLEAIADRQHTHGQIPDEWWALAGLPPGLARTQNDS